jgi:hypothetical protein
MAKSKSKPKKKTRKGTGKPKTVKRAKGDAKPTVVEYQAEPNEVLAQIRKQQAVVDKSHDDVLHCREDLKSANGVLRREQQRLASIIHEDMPLFEPEKVGANPGDTNVEAFPADDESWRECSLEDHVDGLTDHDLSLLAESNITTMGDVADFGSELAGRVKGIGIERGEKINAAFDEFWRKWRDRKRDEAEG